MKLSGIKTYYQEHKNTYSEHFRLRIHRSLSWLEKAEERWSVQDWDFAFQSMWIAFNAAYAYELDGRTMPADRNKFQTFLNKVCALDTDKQIYALVWKEFSGAIRSLLGNRYVFQEFWDFHNGYISEAAYLECFEKERRKVNSALAAQDTATVLFVLFDRLYTLRNQMVHGGATYNSSANREQLKDACKILGSILPVMLSIIQKNADKDWGKPFYPFVKED